MSKKILIRGIGAAFLLVAFYVGEFVTGDLHFITKCSPPKELDCKNANLSGVVLRDMDLRDAKFSGANLRTADLSGSNLRGVDLSNANLSSANLSNAKLLNTNLSGTNLTLAILTNAVLAADMSGAILKETTMPDGTVKSGELPQARGYQTPSSSKSNRRAVSLICVDGKALANCQVRWSDGQIRRLPFEVGPRKGGVVDGIIYYDFQGNPACILLYADGSILTSYDTSKCA